MTIKIQWKPSHKQLIAFNYLNDQETTEVLYGGGAGGGKSYLGCCWLIIMCLKYPGTRYLMGRAILKTLKESTLLTFFGVCRQWGLKKDVDYKYNPIEGTITFTNGSAIYLKDLFAYPSDPEFDELGSTEFTGAFIDEASQITHKAYNIVMSRLRYRLDEYKIKPKILVATNPTKNFLYAEFYKKAKEGTIEKYRKFVPALVGDNPFISHYYIENLNKLDNISKERLLLGNWEYDDDPTKLFDYDKILDMFTLPRKEEPREQKYLSVDIARYGDDKTVIILWYGLHIQRMQVLEKKSLKEIRHFIEQVIAMEGIPRSNIVIDEDGIGGGLVDEMTGVKGFVNNSKAYETEATQKIHNFANLKSQCYFKLADLVNNGKISIYQEINPEYKKLIIEDLEQIKRKDADKDTKLAIVSKEDMKELLGRSTDLGDAIMMRMYYLVRPKITAYISV